MRTLSNCHKSLRDCRSVRLLIFPDWLLSCLETGCRFSSKVCALFLLVLTLCSHSRHEVQPSNNWRSQQGVIVWLCLMQHLWVRCLPLFDLLSVFDLESLQMCTFFVSFMLLLWNWLKLWRRSSLQVWWDLGFFFFFNIMYSWVSNCCCSSAAEKRWMVKCMIWAESQPVWEGGDKQRVGWGRWRRRGRRVAPCSPIRLAGRWCTVLLLVMDSLESFCVRKQDPFKRWKWGTTNPIQSKVKYILHRALSLWGMWLCSEFSLSFEVMFQSPSMWSLNLSEDPFSPRWCFTFTVDLWLKHRMYEQSVEAGQGLSNGSQTVIFQCVSRVFDRLCRGEQTRVELNLVLCGWPCVSGKGCYSSVGAVHVCVKSLQSWCIYVHTNYGV